MNKAWNIERLPYINACWISASDQNRIDAFIHKLAAMFVDSVKVECYTVDIDAMGRVIFFMVRLTDGHVSSGLQISMEEMLRVSIPFEEYVCRVLLDSFSREKYLVKTK